MTIIGFLPFRRARRFVRALGLRSVREWREYCKSGKKPANIPSQPDRVYKAHGWIGFCDWLGLREFLPFEEAREFVRALGLRSFKEWTTYSKSSKRPTNIPSNPHRTYKNDWAGLGDWLGTGNIATFNRKFLPFEEARKFVRTLGLATQRDWVAYSKSGEKPANIPSSPHHVYKDDGWVNTGDWLGVYRPGFLPFEEARRFARTLGLKSVREWLNYCRSGEKPNEIPADPRVTYRNSGWIGFGDWLGTENMATCNKEFMPFEEAREFVRALGLKSIKEWRKYCSSGKKPSNIPTNPNRVYEDLGWVDTGDWLGTGSVYSREFLSFEKAREFTRTLGLRSTKEWCEYCRSGRRPIDIPSNPHRTYKNDGWAGLRDWLGF